MSSLIQFTLIFLKLFVWFCYFIYHWLCYITFWLIAVLTIQDWLFLPYAGLWHGFCTQLQWKGFPRAPSKPTSIWGKFRRTMSTGLMFRVSCCFWLICTGRSRLLDQSFYLQRVTAKLCMFIVVEAEILYFKSVAKEQHDIICNLEVYRL